jgi:hypothetical protein
MNILVRGARAQVWQVGLYIHRLTDEYNSFLFSTTYFGCLPEWGVSKTSKLYNISHKTIIWRTIAISHTYHQIHNIVYDKQNKFDNYIVHNKWNENQNYGKRKQRMTTAPCRCRWILLSGSRGCRQSCIPSCCLVILSRPERHVNGRVRNVKWTC